MTSFARIFRENFSRKTRSPRNFFIFPRIGITLICQDISGSRKRPNSFCLLLNDVPKHSHLLRCYQMLSKSVAQCHQILGTGGMLFFVVSFVISEEQRRTAKDVRFEKRQNLSWVRNILTFNGCKQEALMSTSRNRICNCLRMPRSTE